MSEPGTALTRQTINAGGRIAAIVPQSFDDAWRIAKALAESGMTPKDISTPEKCLAIIMAGAEIGMPPFQALQSFAIINGRPALWGDGMLAVARAGGMKVSERIEGDGDGAVARCIATRPDGEEIERTFSVSDAKAAGLWKKAGPWSTYPKRMLQMRARAWALRDGAADILRGIRMAEEAQDIPADQIHVLDTYEHEHRAPEIAPPSAHAVKRDNPDLWPWIESTIREHTDMGALDAWWSSDETVAMISGLPRKWRDCAQETYDARLSELADQMLDRQSVRVDG